jgi:hypothetical protein
VLNVYWPEIPKDYHVDFLTRSESRYVRLMALASAIAVIAMLLQRKNRAIAKTGVKVHAPGQHPTKPWHNFSKCLGEYLVNAKLTYLRTWSVENSTNKS